MRADRQVKVRGQCVELDEIELALAGLAGVRQAAVELRDGRLVAYAAVAGADEEALRAGLAERLPSYIMPSGYVVLDTLPLTATGKVDWQALVAPVV